MTKDEHRQAVADAIHRGEDVPTRVVAEYFAEQLASIPKPKDYGDEIASLRAALDDKSRYERFSENGEVAPLAERLAVLEASIAALQAHVDSLNARMAIVERTETTVFHRGPDGKIESCIKRVG